MGVFPLCVPYVNKVIKNLFSHFGRFVYVKLKLNPLFGSRDHLYCVLVDTMLNYFKQNGKAPPSRRSMDMKCSPFSEFDVADGPTYTSLLVGMPNFNRKSLLIQFFISAIY
jgi:hypothetical protein